MSAADIPMERNPVYGAPDGVLVSENPAYSLPSVSLPAATTQPPTTATDGDEQQSGVLVSENPAYGLPNVSLPAATPQPPTTTATDEDEQLRSDGDGEYEPVDC